MLRANDYYVGEGLVCYFLWFYNQYSYGELSMFVLFILSLDTLIVIIFLLLYLDLRHKFYFSMFYL